jgi:hypothetical protein
VGSRAVGRFQLATEKGALVGEGKKVAAIAQSHERLQAAAGLREKERVDLHECIERLPVVLYEPNESATYERFAGRRELGC